MLKRDPGQSDANYLKRLAKELPPTVDQLQAEVSALRTLLAKLIRYLDYAGTEDLTSKTLETLKESAELFEYDKEFSESSRRFNKIALERIEKLLR